MKADKIRYLFLAALLLPVFLFAFHPTGAKADIQSEIEERNRQITELENQIAEYQKQIQLNQSQAATLSGEIAKLNAIISKIRLEIRSLNLSIDQTDDEIILTQQKIAEAKRKIASYKAGLAVILRDMYEMDQQNLTKVLLKHDNLSDFFGDLNNIVESQDNLRINIKSLQEANEELESRQGELKSKKSELETLRSIQLSQKNNLDQPKRAKDSILQKTKGEEMKYQQLVKQKKRDIEAIREQITYLLQHGISLEDAIAQAQLAAIRVGIRPAFLLGLLEVESRIGKFQGSGNWKDDMYECYLRLGDIYYPHKRAYYHRRAEREKSAFFAIVNKLGLNPDSVKVSAEPTYGCGGAMGPAQFIPTTWLGYEADVERLTGHRPANPWNTEDAFTASALKLARAGATAKTRAAEIGAAKAYVGGSTTCSSRICNYYANLVLEKAAIIERNL